MTNRKRLRGMGLDNMDITHPDGGPAQPLPVAAPDARLAQIHARLARARVTEAPPRVSGRAFGAALSPPEFPPMAPRRPGKGVRTDLRRWTPIPSGGHLAALGEPVAFAARASVFFTSLAGPVQSAAASTGY